MKLNRDRALWKARAPLQWVGFFLNQEVETHKAPFRFAPNSGLGSGLRDSRVWFATTKLARNCIVCNGSLVRNNKARPCTAQGTRRLSRPTRTRMHSQHQLALPTPMRAPTPTRTDTRSPTHTHAKTHDNAQPRTTKRTLNRRSRCWDHGNSHDRASPVYQDWNEVSRLANDRITSSKLATFLARQRPVLQFQLFE